MSLADALPMGILITDAENRCVYSNAVYQRLCGWAANEIKGSYWCSVVHPEDHATVTRDWQQSLSTNSPFQCEARLKRAEGEDVWTRRHIAAMHEGMPEHDPLTGLLNRYGFAERFDQSMALARRHNKQMGMLFIDLDNFKHINDTLGHGRADRLLESLAKKLLSCVRASDMVCRHGGDEFLVLLNEIAEADHAVAVADKVREAVASERIMLDDKEVALRVSVGVSVYPDDGESLATLLQNADAAMYRVKVSRKRDMSKAGSYTIASQQQQV